LRERFVVHCCCGGLDVVWPFISRCCVCLSLCVCGKVDWIGESDIYLMDVFDRRSDRRRNTVEVGSVFNKQARVDDTSLLEEEDDHDLGDATRRK
jgi:hypothetical protein